MLLIHSVVRAQTAAIRVEERSPTTVADLLKPETSPSVRDYPSGPPSEVEGATRPGHLDCRSFARPREVADVIMAAAGHKVGDAASGSALECDELDRKLIDSIAHGDHTAIRELHRRYYHRIASFVRAVTYRSDFIDEVANDTLWVVWQCAARFRGESKVSTWIMGIARNLSFKAIRAMRAAATTFQMHLGSRRTKRRHSPILRSGSIKHSHGFPSSNVQCLRCSTDLSNPARRFHRHSTARSTL